MIYINLEEIVYENILEKLKNIQIDISEASL